VVLFTNSLALGAWLLQLDVPVTRGYISALNRSHMDLTSNSVDALIANALMSKEQYCLYAVHNSILKCLSTNKIKPV